MKRFFPIAFLLLIVSTGCDAPEEHSGHAHDHGDGLEHDHSGEDEHVDRSLHLVSFTQRDELYLQYELLVAGHDSVFLAHFTNLDDYSPVPGGFITITLSGGGKPEERFTGKRPVRDGIHIEIALPQHTGERELTVTLHSPTYTTTHHLGRVTVYPFDKAPKEAPPRNRPDHATYLEKEKQWEAGIIIRRAMPDAVPQLVLPVSALHHDNHDTVLFVMQGAEFFERRVVEAEQINHNQIVITKGLKPDESVVIRGGEFFHNDENTSRHHHDANDDEEIHNH